MHCLNGVITVAEIAVVYRLLRICRRQYGVSRAVRLTRNDTFHDMDSTLFLVQKSWYYLVMRVPSQAVQLSVLGGPPAHTRHYIRRSRCSHRLRSISTMGPTYEGRRP